jgi:hypothetical protein
MMIIMIMIIINCRIRIQTKELLFHMKMYKKTELLKRTKHVQISNVFLRLEGGTKWRREILTQLRSCHPLF